jgi:hypothetical protein
VKLSIGLLLIISVLSHNVLMAVTVDVPKDISTSYLDSEAGYEAELPSDRLDKLNVFKLSLTFRASVSNNIEILFGRDGKFGAKDGALALEETDWSIGIDCGVYFLRANGFKDTYTYTPADFETTRDRILKASFRVDKDGSVKSIVFSNNDGVFDFTGLQTDPCPSYLQPALWTDLRVAVRNSDTQSVDVKYLRDAALVIIR